jgi:hypothetical protein
MGISTMPQHTKKAPSEQGILRSFAEGRIAVAHHFADSLAPRLPGKGF